MVVDHTYAVRKPYPQIVGMGLVKAKMDQVRRVVVCTRWTHRTLDTVNWQQMRERLVRVKEALQSSAEAIRAASVLEVTPALSGDTATVTA